MDMFDVLIVGGGPAGSTCAKRLVDAGANVALVDRARFPRDKVCAGWITPAVVRTLGVDLDDYARMRTLQPFTGCGTGMLPGQRRFTDFGAAVSYGIRRCEFDDYLLRRSGVRRLEEQDVRQIRREPGGWIVNDSIHARMLVGAGGHFCPVAAVLNHGISDEPVVAAHQAEFELKGEQAASCPVSATSPELFFWPDLSGYGWCMRKGPCLNIGAGRVTPSPLPVTLHEFAAVLESRGIVLPDGPPKWQGHTYLLHRASRRRLHGDGVLLVGDAAGLALAPSGEGILTAVESGLLAANVILAAGRQYSASRLAWYSEHLDARFGPRPHAATSTRAVPPWVSTALSSVLLGLPWITRRVVLEKKFLHKRRPDLRMAS